MLRVIDFFCKMIEEVSAVFRLIKNRFPVEPVIKYFRMIDDNFFRKITRKAYS